MKPSKKKKKSILANTTLPSFQHFNIQESTRQLSIQHHRNSWKYVWILNTNWQIFRDAMLLFYEESAGRFAHFGFMKLKDLWSMETSIEVVQHIARRTSQGVGQFHYDAWQRSWLWPSATEHQYFHSLYVVVNIIVVMPYAASKNWQRKMGLIWWVVCLQRTDLKSNGSVVEIALGIGRKMEVRWRSLKQRGWDGWCDMISLASMEPTGFSQEHFVHY